MRRTCYWILFMILWLFLCLPTILAQEAAGPRMLIEEKFFNAHQVKEGEIIEHSFTIKNKGDQILEIRKVNPGWGCAVAQYDRAIPPGGEGRITLRIKTKGYQGEIRKRARVITNDPQKKVETIGISAFIKVPIYLSPRYVYLRGPADRKVTRTVKVRAGEKRPLTLEESNFNLGNKIIYTIEEVEPGKFFMIHFTSIPGPPEHYRGILTLKTNYPERPRITIPIKARFNGAGTMKKRGKN